MAEGIFGDIEARNARERRQGIGRTQRGVVADRITKQLLQALIPLPLAELEARSMGQDVEPFPIAGGFRYGPGRLPARDLPEPFPTSAVRTVEAHPQMRGPVYHGTDRSFGDYDPRMSGGPLGDGGAYVTSEPRYASAMSRTPASLEDGLAPQVRMHSLREGNVYEMDAPAAQMDLQMDKIARAFADRQALRTKNPGMWGRFYADARKTLAEPIPYSGNQRPGHPNRLGDLGRQMASTDRDVREAAGKPFLGIDRDLDGRMRTNNLLRHAGFSSVKMSDKRGWGDEWRVLSPKAQLENPHRPRPRPLPPPVKARNRSIFEVWDERRRSGV